MLSIILAWVLTYYVPESYNHLLPGLYFINALAGTYISRKLGALRGEWIEGLPRSIFALAPLIGIQLLFQEQVSDYAMDFFKILGSVSGFLFGFYFNSYYKGTAKVETDQGDL